MLLLTALITSKNGGAHPQPWLFIQATHFCLDPAAHTAEDDSTRYASCISALKIVFSVTNSICLAQY